MTGSRRSSAVAIAEYSVGPVGPFRAVALLFEPHPVVVPALEVPACLGG